MNFLIIDVGTSSMRGILFDETGTMLHTERRTYDLITKECGWVEQNPSDFLVSMTEITRNAVQYADAWSMNIDAVAVTSQRSSVIPVDRWGNALENAQMWQDKRTVPLCVQMKEYDNETFARCGSRLNPVFSGPKMCWIKDNQPEIYEKAWKMVVIPDYMIAHMTGVFCTDYTYGSRSLLMNLKENQWDSEMLRMFGIDEGRLCELRPPGSIMGYVTDAYSQATGLRQGTPVISSGGDQQCGMLGQGVMEPGKVSVTLGTGGFLMTPCDHVPDHLKCDVVCNASADAGKYILEASVLTCTSAMEWFRSNFYRGEADFYEMMNETIEKVPPGSHGCMAFPYFQGRSTPDWNSSATASFYNLSLCTTREDMLKALLESICMEIGQNIRSFEHYLQIDQVFVNGGLTKSSAFNQLQSEVYGKRVICANHAESTAIGALMVAAKTMGCYESIQEAYKKIRTGSREMQYTPHEEIHRIYLEIQKNMMEMYQKIWR